MQRLLEQAVLRQRVEEEFVREADELEIRPVRALPPVVRAKRPDDDALQLRAAGRIEHIEDVIFTLDRVQEDARPVAAGREIGKRDLRVNRVDTLELVGKDVVVVPAVLLPFIGFVRVHPAVGQPVDAVAAGDAAGVDEVSKLRAVGEEEIEGVVRCDGLGIEIEAVALFCAAHSDRRAAVHRLSYLDLKILVVQHRNLKIVLYARHRVLLRPKLIRGLHAVEHVRQDDVDIQRIGLIVVRHAEQRGGRRAGLHLVLQRIDRRGQRVVLIKIVAGRDAVPDVEAAHYARIVVPVAVVFKRIVRVGRVAGLREGKRAGPVQIVPILLVERDGQAVGGCRVAVNDALSERNLILRRVHGARGKDGGHAEQQRERKHQDRIFTHRRPPSP